MDIAKLIPLVVQASVLILVFALGLGATAGDATYVLRRPRLLVPALLAIYVVVPLFAVMVAALFGLYPVVKLALVLMTVSPVPPILPGKQLKLGCRPSYVYGLLVAASLFAIVFVPLAIQVLGWVFQREVHVAVGVIAKVVLITVLAPLIAGLALRHWAPALAERTAPWASRVGTVLLLAGLVPILIAAGPGIFSLIGNGTVVAFAAVGVVGLIAGHLLGGPDPGDRSALAFASAMRHPGVALAVANINFPGQRLVLAAVLLSTMVNLIVTIPYASWWKRRYAGIAQRAAVGA